MSQNRPVNDNLPAAIRDRRAESRSRGLLQGEIVYPHDGLTADCTIRDLSAGGARITVHPEPPGGEPYLIVVRDAVVHRSQPVWRTSARAGMRLVDRFDLGGDASLRLARSSACGWSSPRAEAL